MVPIGVSLRRSVHRGMAIPTILLALVGFSRAGTFDEHDPRRFYLALSSPEPVVRSAARAVVWFERGTGFVVSAQGHVLTTEQVAQLEGSTTEGRLSNGRWVDLEYVGGDAELDVALYRRAEPVPAPAWIDLRVTPVEAGERVAVIGNPDGMPLRVSFGQVVDARLRMVRTDGPPAIGYSAVAWWGSSGSPVIDDRGRAVGVHWGWERWHDQPFAGVPMQRILTAFPALADVVSGCPEPARALRTRMVVTARGLRATLTGSRACLERIREVVWVDDDGREMPGTADRRGRAWVRGRRPFRARVRLEAGHEVEVRARPARPRDIPLTDVPWPG